MLIEPSIDEMEKINDNRFELALVVARRARDLKEGKPPLTGQEETNTVSQATKEYKRGLFGVTKQ